MVSDLVIFGGKNNKKSKKICGENVKTEHPISPLRPGPFCLFAGWLDPPDRQVRLDNEKLWSLCADRLRRITLYYQTQVSLHGTRSEPLRLGPTLPVKNRNSLVCLLGSQGHLNRISLAGLRNAGSYSAESYCTYLGAGERSFY